MTLVTYDLRSIPPLLRAWSERSKATAGVIFVDRKSIPANDIGGLVAALIRVWDVRGAEDWTNISWFLDRM
ncbi:MAG: hypothetical protein ACR2GA_01555 [Chloroflexota bacterium]